MKGSKKAIPTLPASSRMQMPTTGGTKMAMKVGSKGVTKKVAVASKGKGMAKKSGY